MKFGRKIISVASHRYNIRTSLKICCYYCARIVYTIVHNHEPDDCHQHRSVLVPARYSRVVFNCHGTEMKFVPYRSHLSDVGTQMLRDYSLAKYHVKQYEV